MSATLDNSANKQADMCGVHWRRESNDTLSPVIGRRPKYYYYRLESESSCSRASDDDTESIYSIQDKETDIAKDTSDTDTKSEGDFDVEIEFEVASSSESEHERTTDSSSGSERAAQHDVIFAVAAAAIANNIDEWITDCEESDGNSTADETSFDRMDFSTCIQCHGRNDHPLYRYCEKCFQMCRECKKGRTYKNLPLCNSCYKNRKKFLPPRPKRFRKSRLKTDKPSASSVQSITPTVKLDTLRNCLSGLSSQDSGLGSSQECPVLELDRIVVPEHLTSPGTSQTPDRYFDDSGVEAGGPREPSKVTRSEKNLPGSVSPSILGSCSSWNVEKCRKRQISESSLSDFEVVKKPKLDNEKLALEKPQLTSDLSVEKTISLSQTSTTMSSTNSVVSNDSEIVKSSENSQRTITSPDERSVQSDLCIFCNNAPKNSVFLHTNMAHMCCCYACAKKTLNRIKRCPICNRPVNKIVKIYTC